MTTLIKLKPLNSFLVQAYYNWLVASDARIFIAVDGSVVQPELQHHIREGSLMLNISPMAAPSVEITEEYLSTELTFGGRHVAVRIPMHGIKGIYNPELGVGTGLPVMEPPTTTPEPDNRPRAKLMVVK